MVAAQANGGGGGGGNGSTAAVGGDGGSGGGGGDDDGDISNPAGGADAKAIIQNSKSMVHTSADSADGGDNSSDALSGSDKAAGGGGNGTHQGQHGACVLGCATQSTQGVGCGNDLSKPDCFCKSQDFINQAFSCVNATCPEQYHGAAGVVTSICGAASAAPPQIPGYRGSDNLENMPKVVPDDQKPNNGTSTNNSTGTAANGTTPTPASTLTLTSTMAAATSTSTQFKFPTDSSNNGTPGTSSSAAPAAPISLPVHAVCAVLVATVLGAAGIFTLV
ncbi:hypothetical protein BCV70DRAFT_216444 [Testicularia cyperi]|uniref:CFEM domain-containing protein n=1 Tax=Testicularia cyperi TaxID=1882483 RepID=A0A317XSQ8_9BASI|nr:hypothetical protein BCV70DRAFT_216444 [Testicularia cyperi]